MHVNLAMQCIANIGSKDMAEAFGQEIPRLLVSAEAIDFVKSSAALCLLRLFRTSPEVGTECGTRRDHSRGGAGWDGTSPEVGTACCVSSGPVQRWVWARDQRMGPVQRWIQDGMGSDQRWVRQGRNWAQRWVCEGRDWDQCSGRRGTGTRGRDWSRVGTGGPRL